MGQPHWSDLENEVFFGYILPQSHYANGYYNPNNGGSSFHDLARIMQEEMALRGERRRRTYDEGSMFQHFYQRYSKRAVERGEGDVVTMGKKKQPKPATSQHTAPSRAAARPGTRKRAHSADDEEDEEEREDAMDTMDIDTALYLSRDNLSLSKEDLNDELLREKRYSTVELLGEPDTSLEVRDFSHSPASHLSGPPSRRLRGSNGLDYGDLSQIGQNVPQSSRKASEKRPARINKPSSHSKQPIKKEGPPSTKPIFFEYGNLPKIQKRSQGEKRVAELSNLLQEAIGVNSGSTSMTSQPSNVIHSKSFPKGIDIAKPGSRDRETPTGID